MAPHPGTGGGVRRRPARSCGRGRPRFPTDGFNPHGISIDEAHNLMVTSDFICPAAHAPCPRRRRGGSPRQRQGVGSRADATIIRTIAVGDPGHPAGTMEVQLIPRDRGLRAFTAGMVDNKLYLVDTQEGTATAVFDFDVFSSPEHAGDAAAPPHEPGGHASVRHTQRRRQGRHVQHRASEPSGADERRGPRRRLGTALPAAHERRASVWW